MEPIKQALVRAAGATAEQLQAYLPQLVAALALLLLGWLLAQLMRLATRRSVVLLDALIARNSRQSRWRIGHAAVPIAALVFWGVLLFFFAAATQTLGLQTFTDWLARLLNHLPALAVGLLIIVAGYALSGFVGEVVQAAAAAMPTPQRHALARVAQGATLVVALLVGADQIGLKVTWIAIFAAVLVASLLGGLAIAISLGARSFVTNMIGAHYLRQALQVGQRVRVAGHEGRVLDINATSLVLETADGRVMLPGGLYHAEAILLVARDEAH